MAIAGYFIISLDILLMVIDGYFINVYWWIFLMVIGDYFFNGYW